jgi:hypothetical protein
MPFFESGRSNIELKADTRKECPLAVGENDAITSLPYQANIAGDTDFLLIRRSVDYTDAH